LPSRRVAGAGHAGVTVYLPEPSPGPTLDQRPVQPQPGPRYGSCEDPEAGHPTRAGGRSLCEL